MNTHTGRLMLLAAMALATMLAGCAKKTPEEMLGDADALMQQGNLLEAELKFEDVIDKFPNNETAYYNANLGLAMVYGSEHKYDEQRKIYDKLIKKQGNPAASKMAWMIYCQKLNSYIAEGKRADALRETIETSSTFKNADPEGKMAFQGALASLYAATNQTTTALAVLDNLAQFGMKDPRQQFGVLESKKKLLEPQKAWQRVAEENIEYIKRFPDSPYNGYLQMQTGMIFKEQLHNQAKSDEMLDVAAKSFQQSYDKGINADEKTSGLMQLGGLHQYRGELDKAVKYFDQVIKEFPINKLTEFAYSYKVDIAVARNDPQKAIDILTEMSRVFADRIDSRAVNERINAIKARMAATTDTLTRSESAPTSGTAIQNAPTSTTTGAIR